MKKQNNNQKDKKQNFKMFPAYPSDKQLEEELIRFRKKIEEDGYIIIAHDDNFNEWGVVEIVFSKLWDIYRKDIQEARKGMIKIEDVNKMIDEIKNPYPTDIFPEITEKTFKDIQKVLNEKFLGFPFDRISANLMRRARNILKDELKQSLKNLGDK